MDACADESIYKFDQITDTPQSTGRTTPHSMSASKSRKRKRLRENLAQLANDGDFDSPFHPSGNQLSGTTAPPASKRRSNELARMSFSASFLDATVDTSTTGIFFNKILKNIFIIGLFCRYFFVYLASLENISQF